MAKLLALIICIAATYPNVQGENCPEGKHWVTSYQQGDYLRTDGTLVKAHRVSAHCRMNPRGYDSWHSQIKPGRPKVWKNENEVSTSWSTSETERVLEAVSALPDGLIEQIPAGIYRMRVSVDKANPATANYPKKEIALYDAAFDGTNNLARILAHELSHLMFVRLDKPTRDAFLEAARWVKLDGKRPSLLLQRPMNQTLTFHSRTSPHEDFATSVEYYLFDPAKMRATTPKVHSWIEKHLGDSLKKRSEK